jgi:poly(A) polymerase
MMPEFEGKSPFSEEFHASSASRVLEGALRAGRGEAMDGTVAPLGPQDVEGLQGSDLRTMIEQVLMTPRPEMALIYLKLTGFLAVCLPEIDSLAAFDDGSDEHKDLWGHTIKVVAQTPRERKLRWAALFHDIGKLRTKTTNEKGQIHFIGHERIGAAMAARIMKRLQFPGEEAEEIRILVLEHLRCSQYDSEWTDSAVRRLGKELGGHFENLIKLSRADITTRHARRKEAYLRLLDELWERFERIREEDSRLPLLPSGLGDHIMQAFGLEPGPEIGRIRGALERLAASGQLEARREPEYYINYLNTRGDIVKPII